MVTHGKNTKFFVCFSVKVFYVFKLVRYDVTDSNDMEEIRKMTGICPQHDVLFDELTPREHLTFFARIRVRKWIYKPV